MDVRKTGHEAGQAGIERVAATVDDPGLRKENRDQPQVHEVQGHFVGDAQGRRAKRPQGLEVLNLSNWSAFTIPLNVSAEVTTRASGHLAGSAFTGIFFAMIKYHELMTAVSLEGAFHIQLA